MRLTFVVGDNKNPSYREEATVVVSNEVGEKVQAPYDAEAERVYNRFCDRNVPNAIENLPYDWYFIKSPREAKR